VRINSEEHSGLYLVLSTLQSSPKKWHDLFRLREPLLLRRWTYIFILGQVKL